MSRVARLHSDQVQYEVVFFFTDGKRSIEGTCDAQLREAQIREAIIDAMQFPSGRKLLRIEVRRMAVDA